MAAEEVMKRIDACREAQSVTLNLQFCGLKTIPEVVKELKWLHTLNVADNNLTCLTNYPQSDNLKQIDASNNGHKDSKVKVDPIPEGVKTVKLDRCYIEPLKDGILPTSLMMLNLSDTGLVNVKFLRLLTQLRNCDLSHNEIKTVEGCIPSEVRVLDLSQNHLTKFPIDLPLGLETLKISYNTRINAITMMPPRLKFLEAAWCNLSRVEPFPDNMMAADLRHNLLTEIPQMNTSLLTLKMSHNLLTMVDSYTPRVGVGAEDEPVNPIPASCKEVDLSHNNIYARPTVPPKTKLIIQDNPCAKDEEGKDEEKTGSRFPGRTPGTEYHPSGAGTSTYSGGSYKTSHKSSYGHGSSGYNKSSSSYSGQYSHTYRPSWNYASRTNEHMVMLEGETEV